MHVFVIATIGCGISHKDTKNTDKCSNNTKNKTMKPQTNTFSEYCKDNTKVCQSICILYKVHTINSRKKLLHIL
jgi:hypothetical protein